MNGNTRMCQPGCIVYEELNSMIEKLLKHVEKGRDDRFVVYDALSALQMNAIVHRAKEVFLNDLVLVDIYKIHGNGVIVVGDLNGSFEDLVAIIARYGLPPNKYYVFLGNFVNIEKRRTNVSRRIDSLSTVLLIFLLKLRFPNHVTVLRGPNEVYDNNYSSRFSKQCEEYGLDWLYTRFNEAFDELPLCCTVDGYFLAHGGMSQFAQSKIWLKDVEKPIKREQVVDSLIMGDLINSKLDLNLAADFFPGTSGYGFDYSIHSARIMLDTLVCHSMISAQHEEKSGGSIANCSDEHWYYTISSMHEMEAGAMTSSVLSIPENLIHNVNVSPATLPRGIRQLIEQLKGAPDLLFFDRQNLETTDFPAIPDYVQLDEDETHFARRMISNRELADYFEGVAGGVLTHLRKLDRSAKRNTAEYIPLVMDISKRLLTRISAAAWEKRLFAMYIERYGNRLRYPIPDERVFTSERNAISPMKKASMKLLDCVRIRAQRFDD